MKVYKFGGGVLKDVESIKCMTELVAQEENLGVVVSAFNKMTNSFECLYRASSSADQQKAWKGIDSYHRGLINDLLADSLSFLSGEYSQLQKELFKDLNAIQELSFDEGYDQIVPYGELFSSSIISAYWKQVGVFHVLLDARKTIKTNDRFRGAEVLWEETKEGLDFKGRALIQGFVGGTQDGKTTTLGREGSDYTAAILGQLLDAQEVVVWKDVPGVMTADPAAFKNPALMEQISYLEAVELSYFGAKVLHPNTIKPLQNSGIPLIVRSLYELNAVGTCISGQKTKRPNMPVLIEKKNQVLLSIQPRDFSFIMEGALAEVFGHLAKQQIRINLMQHGAVSISLVFDREQAKLDALLNDLLPRFKVLYNTGLSLWTIRHYDQNSLQKLIQGKRIYVQQKSRKTARFVLG